MNGSLWKRSWRISLAVVLGAAFTGILVWGAASAQVTLASDSPLRGSGEGVASSMVQPGDLMTPIVLRDDQVALADGSPLDSSFKTVVPPAVQPGNRVTYTIVLNNSSAVSDVNVLLTDPLDPSFLSYVPGSFHTDPSDSGTLIFPETVSDTTGITWTGTINANQTVTLMFQAQVDDGLSDGTIITNTATVTSTDGILLQLPVTVTVDMQPPSVLVMDPEPGEVVTSSYLLVSGMAWDGTDRPFPDAPVLNPINNPNPFFYYVTWSAVDSAVDYLLQEDASDTFLSPTVRYIGSETQTRIDTQPPGTYYYRVRASDIEGDFSRWSNIVSATITSQSSSPAQFSQSVLAPEQPSDSAVAGVWVRIGGAPWEKASGTSEWIHVIRLPPGIDYAPYTVSAIARDVAGNTSETDTIDIYLDTYAPDVSIGNLTPGQWISTEYTITGTASTDLSGVDRVEISFDDDATWEPVTGTLEWLYTWTPTRPDGTYTVTARSVDGVGNAGTPDAVAVLVDQPPAAPVTVAVVSTTATSAYLTWTASADADVVSYTLYWGTAPESYEESRDVGNVTQYEVTGLRSAQTYYFVVSARDARSEGPLSDEAEGRTGNYVMYLQFIVRRYPPVPYAPTLHDIENSDADGNYTVEWSYDYTKYGPYSYELQEATNADFIPVEVKYSPLYNTTQAISGRQPGTYYYRVRGRNDAGWGEWSDVKSVEVAPPRAPTLNEIENEDQDGNYTVSWSYPYTFPPVDTYTLQEATDASFSSPTSYSPGSSTSWDFTEKEAATYYYRVRGHNGAGAGEWSNIKSVTVVPQRYIDHFDVPTDWAYRRGDDIIQHADNFRIRYKDGRMYVLFVGTFDFAVASPMVEAPQVPYVVRGRVKVVEGESFDGRSFNIRNGTTFGFIFGANGGTPCPADRTAPKNAGCLSHYYRLMMVYDVLRPDGFTWQLKRVKYHDPDDDGKGRGDSLDSGEAVGVGAKKWHEWRVEVTETGMKVYVDDKHLGSTSDTNYINDPYFGVYMGSPDIGDTGVKWDWFEVKPMD